MSVNIAIVGATGMVGNAFLTMLEESNIQINQLLLYASKRSAGKTISFQGKEYTVLECHPDNIKHQQIDYALFSAGAGVSLEYAPLFEDIGAVVVDNSSAWRMHDHIPLVVPEINMDDTKDHSLIANPNCSTIQSVLPLYVLQQHYGISNVSYVTYQAVSGSGYSGIHELKRTTKGEEAKHYPYPIYNNVIPQIDVFLDNGYTKEEMKMIQETKKILHQDDLHVTATCVRVPIEHSHSVEIHVTLQKEFQLEDVKHHLHKTQGIQVVDQHLVVPTMATNQNDVLVGRIRRDINDPQSLHIFCVADNIRKGAAYNAVQIVEELIKRSDSNV